MLTVVPAVVLLAACGAPEAVPVAPAAAVTPVTARATAAPTSQPTSQPLGVVPVDMGPAEAQEVIARAAGQAADPPRAPTPPRQAAPKPSAQPAPKPAPQPVAQPAPKPKPAPKPPASGPAGGCNANYTPCVPNDSDVDCQGGSGNGPSYVTGPVQVVGTDVYGLDADKDGVGCE